MGYVNFCVFFVELLKLRKNHTLSQWTKCNSVVPLNAWTVNRANRNQSDRSRSRPVKMHKIRRIGVRVKAAACGMHNASEAWYTNKLKQCGCVVNEYTLLYLKKASLPWYGLRLRPYTDYEKSVISIVVFQGRRVAYKTGARLNSYSRRSRFNFNAFRISFAGLIQRRVLFKRTYLTNL